MCGIAGYISDKRLDGAEMLSCLHHRGPDHNGNYTGTALNKTIFTGHTRLSILDLSQSGNQPMLSADKSVVLTFNGEIYNFKDLKSRFLSKESFHSATDTEVILKLYEKMGLDSVQELNGDFAISIYDKKVQKLYLLRDRAGVKPLYYYFDGTSFVYASEIKGIIAAGVRKELNKDELLNYFVFKYSPQNSTLFKNIYRLSPASVLEFDIAENNFSVKRYWEAKKKSEYTGLSYTDAQHCLYGLLENSVNARLISDVPIGNFLSGGLDSSILAYFIKDRKDITHYCARKNEADLKKEGTTSDYYYAEKLAREWNLDLQAADIGIGEANTALIQKTLYYSDDLIADGSQIPSYLITKKAAETSKVILSGMGADELFLGYAGQMLTLLSSEIFDSLPFIFSPALSLAAKTKQGKGKFLAYRRYIHKLGKYHQYGKLKYALYNVVGDFDNSAAIYRGDKDKTSRLLASYFPDGEDVFDSLFHFETENFLVKNLHYMDRMAMANSVEGRVPFLDHRIMEFAYSIPRHYKLTFSGNFKKIMKDSFRNKVPPYIINRRKAGFGMPLRSIFSNRAKAEELIDLNFFASFDGFSVEEIRRLVDNHVSGKEDNSSVIYALVSFKEWYKVNLF